MTGRRRIARPAILRAPPQGLMSLAVLTMMLLVVGLAVADARRLVAPGSGETAALPLLMVVAALLGFLLARSPVGVVGSHVIGSIVGAGLILLTAAASVVEAPDPLTLEWAVIAARMEALWAEVIRLSAGRSATPGDRWPLALLVLSGICWTTAQFAAFSVFRHGRAGPAVTATGLLLLLNVSFPNVYVGLEAAPTVVLFALLALLLLVRLHLVHQQEEWGRRHISDAADVSRLFLRSGVLFVVLVTMGASTLTTIAVNGRADLPVPELEGPLDDLRDQLLELFGDLGIAIPPERVAAEFGERQEIAERWEMGDGIRFRATSESATSTYWWGAAYATFDGRSWSQGPSRRRSVPAGQPLPVGRLEVPREPSLGEDRGRLSVRITPVGLPLRTLLAPATALRSDDRALAAVVGEPGGARVTVDFERRVDRGDSYAVTSLAIGDQLVSDAFGAEDLRSARRSYPAGLERYLAVHPRSVGPRTRRFVAEVDADVRGTPEDNAYDRALIVQTRLRALRYETDMAGVCGDLPATECLLESGQGFCQHFATTMAIALREMDIPTRVVHGYLPGRIVAPDEVEVPLQAAHAWVEVFFPAHGWVRFDPTPGLEALGGRATELPEEGDEGRGDEEREAEASFEVEPPAEPSPFPEPSPDAGAGVTTPEPPGADLARMLLAILASAVAAAAGLAVIGLVLVRRLPVADPEIAYRGVVRLATRLGHAPSAAQTAYEYVGELGEVAPWVREELREVAAVRVRARYAGPLAGIGGESLARLRGAYARARTGLLRLLIRR